MESRARVVGHSLHQIVIVFPLGLLMTSVGFDVLALITHETRWLATSYYVMVVGLLGGVVAMVAGYIDYSAIPNGTRAKKIGKYHGLGSTGVIVIFAVSAYLRTNDPLTLHPLAIGLSLLGAITAGVAGWLGGELVTRMGVGVADGAHVDAGGGIETSVPILRTRPE
jgi:uncharacterized membrane protein